MSGESVKELHSVNLDTGQGLDGAGPPRKRGKRDLEPGAGRTKFLRGIAARRAEERARLLVTSGASLSEAARITGLGRRKVQALSVAGGWVQERSALSAADATKPAGWNLQLEREAWRERQFRQSEQMAKAIEAEALVNVLDAVPAWCQLAKVQMQILGFSGEGGGSVNVAIVTPGARAAWGEDVSRG